MAAAAPGAVASGRSPPPWTQAELWRQEPLPAQGGQPRVRVGLAEGAAQVEVGAGPGGLNVHFRRRGHPALAYVPAGERLRATARAGPPPASQAAVVLGTLSARDPEATRRALASWRRRGVDEVVAVVEGGRVGSLDTRVVRLLWPAPSCQVARERAAEVAQRHGVLATVRARPVVAPVGWVDGRGRGGGRHFTADDLLRATAVSGGPLTVAAAGQPARRVRGEVYLTVDAQGSLTVVNVVAAEELLWGTVPAEMFASAPHEALRAQAVAARSMLAGALGRRHVGAPFDLCAEVHCQAYGGYDAEQMESTAAVVATAGEVLLTDAGQPLQAAFSANCGGMGESNDAVWAEAAEPHLQANADYEPGGLLWPHWGPGLSAAHLPAWVRSRWPSFCAQGSRRKPEAYRWQRRLEGPQLAAIVAPWEQETGPVGALAVAERGPGGRARRLLVRGPRGERAVVGELAIRRALGNLRSASFDLTTSFDAGGVLTQVDVAGAGWGHGVGLCQYGAIGRAEAGWDHAAILAHYYRQARLVAAWGPRL